MLLLGDGRGGLTKQPAEVNDYGQPLSVLGFELLDVDGDSDLDLMGRGDENVLYLLNDGRGAFTRDSRDAKQDHLSASFVLGDLDEDGHRDLAHYVHSSGFPKHPRAKVSVQLGDGKLGFGKARTFDTGVALRPAPPPPPETNSDAKQAREGVPGNGDLAAADLDRAATTRPAGTRSQCGTLTP